MLLAGTAVLALGIYAAQGACMGSAVGKVRLATVEAAIGNVFRERTVQPEIGTFQAGLGTVPEETRPGQPDGGGMAMPETDETATPTEEQREADAETEEPRSQREQLSVSEAEETSPVEPAAGSTGDHSGTGSSGSTGGSSLSGNTSGEGTPTQPPHIHTWEEQTTTVIHEAAGHYETKVVKEAWEEPVYAYRLICNKCGSDVTDDEVRAVHYAFECGGGWSDKKVQTGTIYHEAETEQVWVEDSPAYTETVSTGIYQCSGCGVTK